MENHFPKVTDSKLLEELVTRSADAPVVIFKHSTTCSISASAYREMTKLSNEVHLVEIQSAPMVSQEVEKRTGLRHESPQVIVLRNGKAVWNASHWRITANAVEAAIRENA